MIVKIVKTTTALCSVEYDDYVSKSFHNDLSPLEVTVRRSNTQFRVKGTMGSNHTPIVQIQLYPTHVKDLAPDLTMSGMECQ